MSGWTSNDPSIRATKSTAQYAREQELNERIMADRMRLCPQCRSVGYDADNDVCSVCEAAWDAWVSEEMEKHDDV